MSALLQNSKTVRALFPGVEFWSFFSSNHSNYSKDFVFFFLWVASFNPHAWNIAHIFVYSSNCWIDLMVSDRGVLWTSITEQELL